MSHLPFLKNLQVCGTSLLVISLCMIATESSNVCKGKVGKEQKTNKMSKENKDSQVHVTGIKKI